MSRRRNRARRAGDEVRPPDSAPPPAEPPPGDQRPQFWFGFEVPWAKLVTARVVLFAMLALDALLQVRHAPRYGAGGFNVAQLPGLDAIAPGRVGYGVGQLLDAYLLVLAACGVGTRVVVPAAAAIYAWLYFGSQLDSYQHHYLMALVLAYASFVPWERPARGAGAVRSWAMRLILVQLGILYLWAAISKLTPAWLDGRTLDQQLHGELRSVIDATLGIATTSKLVVVTELALAVTVWLRPAWWFAAPVGILFHLGIVFTGLEIGLFAWLMIAIYVLVIPDPLWRWLGRLPWPKLARSRGRAAWIAAGVVGGIAMAFACRIEDATVLGLVLAPVPVAITWWKRGRSLAWIAAAHVLALGAWVAVDRGSDVTTDYARLWGGSAKRLRDLGTAERAYRQLVELTPDDAGAHARLGAVLLERGSDETDAGLAELHAAQAMDSSSARAWVEEARWLVRHGRTTEAIAKAREGTYAEPGNTEARALLDALTTGRGAPPSPSPTGGGAAARGPDDEPEPR